MQSRLAPLTSLRFFAALLVLCQHYFQFTFGHAGVSFFYVLSGFILTYNYDGKIGREVSAQTFYWKRFARIYPTHIVTLLLALPLALEISVKGAIKFGFNLLLLQSFVPLQGIYFSFDAPSWSISDEAFFYALFPLLVITVTPRIAILWFCALLGLALAWITLWHNSTLHDPVTHWLFYINPFFRLTEFAIGVALGRTFNRSSRIGTGYEITAVCFAALTIASAYWLPVQAGPLLCGLWFMPAAVMLIWAIMLDLTIQSVPA